MVDFNKLACFLYYQAVNIPNYFLSGVVLGMQKLEEKKVASELEKKRAVVEKTTQSFINTAQLVSLL